MNTGFNKSFINSSNTIIKVIPSEKREQDTSFDPSSITFNWQTVYFVNLTMIVQLNFTHPLEISPNLIPD